MYYKELAVISGKGLHKGAVLQHSGPERAFKGLGIAKRCCSIDLIGDIFVQGLSTSARTDRRPQETTLKPQRVPLFWLKNLTTISNSQRTRGLTS